MRRSLFGALLGASLVVAIAAGVAGFEPPLPRSTIALPKTWQARKTDVRLVAISRFHSSSSISKNGVELFTPGATDGSGAAARRWREPTWEELRGLSAEERRAVIDYFRRMNAEAKP